MPEFRLQAAVAKRSFSERAYFRSRRLPANGVVSKQKSAGLPMKGAL